MRLREVFRYELAYRLRSASTWLYPGLLFLIAMWMFLATADGGDSHFNAPERIAGGSVLVGMLGMLVSAAIFGGAAVRDVEVGMDPLLFACPLRKIDYLGGRFLAALAVNAAVLVAIPLAVLTVTRLAASFEPVGPFRLAAYLHAFFLLLLPNLVVVGAILFTIGVLARHVVPVYLSAIGLFIGYVVALNSVGAIESPVLAALADPSGIGALLEVTQYWTEAERNTRLIGFPALVVWNRVVWLAVATAVLALLLGTFRFAHPDGGRRRGKRRGVREAPMPVRAGPVAVPRVAGSFGRRTAARQVLAVARHSLAQLAASRAFVVVLLALPGLVLLFGWNVGETVFDTSTWPVTLLVAGTVLTERINPLIVLLVVLYAGELVWKERDVGVAEIADAAPVSEGAALLGKLIALVAMIATIQLATLVGGVLIQTLQGHHRFELDLYLRVLGLNLADHVLLAALALTIHVVVNHKYVGHILVLMAFAATLTLPQLGLVQHHLLLYGTDPGWIYSDMNGFGPFLAPFLWFKLYWAAWALLLLVVASLSWVRGREPGLRRRLRAARARFAGPVVRAAGVALALILVLGGFVFYNTNVLNEYRAAHEDGAPQAELEKRYGKFADTPQPVIVAADLRVEIYPEEPAVDLAGTYRLVNRSGAPIDAVHVYLARDVEARALSFDRASTPAVTDDEVGYRIHALERALEPGDTLQLAFDVTFRPRGFRNGGSQTDVVENGTSFDRRWLPIIGYPSVFELTDEDARERFDLGPRPPMPGPDDADARARRYGLRDSDLVHVEAVIGTAADQIAITPGVLRRSWTENGRSYFHYETEEPTAFGVAVYSGRYAVVEDRWNDVDLRIYHHPPHAYNLDRTIRSMKASLDYFTEQFGPYPSDHLRIVEFPRYGGFGVAHPHTIGFAEDYFLGRVREGEVDQPFYGTAHEVAHHWWGGRVRGAVVRGHGFLSESLANYSAMMVTEETYGLEAARRVYGFQLERYLLGRASQSREVPLLEVEDQPYIAYRKGAIALYMLREHIGAERVNTALRRYFEQHRDAGPPYPTSLDLYAELRAVTPDSHQALLRDLFEEVTLWDVATKRANAAPTATGEYTVTIDVAARKTTADGVGNETEVPMDDLVEIGVFAPGEGDALGEPLHLEHHRIRSGAQTITITVPREPARAGIDPYRKLIDRVGDDNVAEVGITPRASM